MLNKQRVYKASVVVRGEGCAFEKVVGMERSVGNPAPFGKGAKNVVLSVG